MSDRRETTEATPPRWRDGGAGRDELAELDDWAEWAEVQLDRLTAARRRALA